MVRGMRGLAFLAIVLLPSGCMTAIGAAGGGGHAYAYALGQGKAWFEADFADTWHASREALMGLGLPIKGEQRHRLSGTMESTAPDGASITLELVEQPLRAGVREHQTEVRLRIGLFGDQRITEHLLEQIQQRLDARRAAVPPPPLPPTTASPPPVPPQERPPSR